MNNKRYFFFAALMIYANDTMCHQNFGQSYSGFPTMKQLEDTVRKNYPEASLKAVVILSICELSEEDYRTLWGDKLQQHSSS